MLNIHTTLNNLMPWLTRSTLYSRKFSLDRKFTKTSYLCITKKIWQNKFVSVVKVAISSVQPLTHDKKIHVIQIVPMRAGGENFRLYSTFNYIKKAHLLINNFSYTCIYKICIFYIQRFAGWLEDHSRNYLPHL